MYKKILILFPIILVFVLLLLCFSSCCLFDDYTLTEHVKNSNANNQYSEKIGAQIKEAQEYLHTKYNKDFIDANNSATKVDPDKILNTFLFYDEYIDSYVHVQRVNDEIEKFEDDYQGIDYGHQAACKLLEDNELQISKIKIIVDMYATKKYNTYYEYVQYFNNVSIDDGQVDPWGRSSVTDSKGRTIRGAIIILNDEKYTHFSDEELIDVARKCIETTDFKVDCVKFDNILDKEADFKTVKVINGIAQNKVIKGSSSITHDDHI